MKGIFPKEGTEDKVVIKDSPAFWECPQEVYPSQEHCLANMIMNLNIHTAQVREGGGFLVLTLTPEEWE
jgi:hypothetical protein